jgi:hypothetical protein
LQIDIVAGDILVLFLTVGLSMLFGYFFKEIADWIKVQFRPEIHVQVELAVHKFDGGAFLHSMFLKFTNMSETETRIDNITMYDKSMRELNFDTHNTSPLVFNVRGGETQNWWCSCHRDGTGETGLVKLRLAIDRLGKRRLWKIFESRLVTDEEFPAQHPFRVF